MANRLQSIISRGGLRSVRGHLALLAFSILFLAPFAWLVSTSLKHESSIFPKPGEPPEWIPRTIQRDAEGRRLVNYRGSIAVDLGVTDDGAQRLLVNGAKVRLAEGEAFEVRKRIGLHWQNYVQAFQTIDVVQSTRNTLFVCFMCVIGTVLSCALVAYGFSRIEWPGRNLLFIVVISTMMIPYQVTLIPLFVLYKQIGWSGSFKPLTMPAFFGAPFFIFLLRQFFMGVPRDLSAAARIDGCTEFGIFLRILVPLSKPALATTALFMFLGTWSDFLSPLVFLQDESQFTLAVALQQFQNQHESLWGPLMAMSTVITLPVIMLFFLTQKTFIQGIALTGLKG